MKRLSLLAAVCALSLTVTARPISAQSEGKRESTIIGTIDLEGGDATEQHENANSRQLGVIKLEKEEKKRDPYLVTQDETIGILDTLSKTMAALSRGEAAKPAPIDDQQLLHVAAAYLYCSIKKGVCPDFIDALREIDVIANIESNGAASAGKGSTVCTTKPMNISRTLCY